MIKKIISLSLALVMMLAMAIVPVSATGNQYLIDNFESGNVGRVNQTTGDGYYLSSSASGLFVKPTKKVSSNGLSVVSRVGYGGSAGLVMEVGPSGGEAFVTTKTISIPYDEEMANTVVLSYKLKFLSIPKSSSGKWLGLAHDYKNSSYYNAGYSPIQVAKDNKLSDRDSASSPVLIDTNEWYTVVAEVVPIEEGRRVATAYVLDEAGDVVLKGTRNINSLGSTTALSPVYINGAYIKSGTAKLVVDDVVLYDYSEKTHAPSFDSANTVFKDGATSVDTAGSYTLTFDQSVKADNDAVKIYKKSDSTQTVDVKVATIGNRAKIMPEQSLEAGTEYVLDFSGVTNKAGLALADASVKSISFTTSSVKSAPVLKSSSIANGAADVSFDTKSVTVTFDQEIDIESSVIKLTYGTDGEISATISATGNENEYIVSWTDDLKSETTYTLDLSGVVNSTNPETAGDNAKISFTTIQEEDIKTYNQYLADDFEEGSVGSISQTTGDGYYVSSQTSGLFVNPTKKVSSNGISLVSGAGYNDTTGLVMEVGPSGGEAFITTKSIDMEYGENTTNTLVMTYKIKFLSLPTESSGKWLGLSHNYKGSNYYAVSYAPIQINAKNNIVDAYSYGSASLESDKWYTVVSNFYFIAEGSCSVSASILDENNNVVFSGSRKSDFDNTSALSPVYINGTYIKSGTAKLVLDDVAIYDYTDRVHAPSMDAASTQLKEGATSISPAQSHTIVFDQLINADSEAVKIYKKDDETKAPVAATVTATGNRVTIAPTNSLEIATEYVLDFSGVTNKAGLALADASLSSLSFTTSSVKGAPVLKTSSIANGAADVELSTKSVTVTFDQVIDTALSTAKLTYAADGEISATISATGNENEYIVSWTDDLKSETTYTLDLSGVVNLTNSETAGDNARISFTTISNKTYNQYLADDFEEGSVGSVSQTTGDGYYKSADSSGLFANPSTAVTSNGMSLVSGVGYNGSTGLVMEVGPSGGNAFISSKSINMAYGEGATNTVILSYKLKFLSLPTEASAKWAYFAHDYKNSSYYTAGYAPVTVTKDNLFINKASTASAAAETDKWYTVVSKFYQGTATSRNAVITILDENDNVVISYTRTIELSSAMTITPVYISGAAITSGTAKLVVDDFVLYDYVDATHAPSFDSANTVLKDGATDISAEKEHTLVFNQEVVADNTTVKIYKKADATKTAVAATVTAAGNRVTIAPANSLEIATEYVLNFSGVTNKAGLALADASLSSLSFTTSSVKGAPALKSSSIANGAADVELSTKSVTVTFDQVIDTALSTAKLTYAADGEISATISATGNENEYIVSWTDDLKSETTYTLDLSGVVNLTNSETAGNNARISFTTISNKTYIEYLADDFEEGSVGSVSQTTGDGYYVSSQTSGLFVNPTKKVSSNGISLVSGAGYNDTTGLVMEVGASGGEAFVTTKSISVPYVEENANTVLLSYKLKFLSLPEAASGKWLGLAHDYKSSSYYNVGYSPIQLTKDNMLLDKTDQTTASIDTDEWYTVVAEIDPIASGRRMATAYIINEAGDVVLKGTRKMDSLGSAAALSPVYINGGVIESGTAKLVVDDVVLYDYSKKAHAPSFDSANTELKEGDTLESDCLDYILVFDQVVEADSETVKIYKKADSEKTAIDATITANLNRVKISLANRLEDGAEYVIDFSGVTGKSGTALADASLKTLSFKTEALPGYYYAEENFESFPDKTIGSLLTGSEVFSPTTGKANRTSTLFGEGYGGSMALRAYSPNSGVTGSTKSIELLEDETLFYEFKIKLRNFEAYTESTDSTTGETTYTAQTGIYMGVGSGSFSASPIQVKTVLVSGTKDQFKSAFYGINNWKTHYYNNDEWYTVVYKAVLGEKTYGYVYDKNGKLVCYGYSSSVATSPMSFSFLGSTSYAKGHDIYVDDIKTYKVSTEKLAASGDLGEIYDGATGIEAKDTYIISFNQPLSINTTKTPNATAADIFSLYEGDKEIEATFEQVGANQIRMTLEKPLTEETEYSVKFPALTALGGNTLETEEITFATKGASYPVGIIDSSLEISDGKVSAGDFTITMRNRDNELTKGDIVVAFYSSDDLSTLVDLKVFRAQEFSKDREVLTLTLDKDFADVGKAEIMMYDTLESFIPMTLGYVIK